MPEAFLTFASKSAVGPSYVANGQEDHKTYTNLNDDTAIMTNYCYFESIAQCLGLLRNVHGQDWPLQNKDTHWHALAIGLQQNTALITIICS